MAWTCLSLSEADVVTLRNTVLLHWQSLRYHQDSIYINVSSVWTAIFKSERGENSPHGTMTVQHIHRQETVCSRLKHDTSYAERMSYCLSVLSWKDLQTQKKQTQAPSCLRGVVSATRWLTATVWSECTVQYSTCDLIPSFVLIGAPFVCPANKSWCFIQVQNILWKLGNKSL